MSSRVVRPPNPTGIGRDTPAYVSSDKTGDPELFMGIYESFAALHNWTDETKIGGLTLAMKGDRPKHWLSCR